MYLIYFFLYKNLIGLNLCNGLNLPLDPPFLCNFRNFSISFIYCVTFHKYLLYIQCILSIYKLKKHLFMKIVVLKFCEHQLVLKN